MRRDGLPSRARLRAGGARLRARLCQRCAVPPVGAIRLGSRGGMDNGSKGGVTAPRVGPRLELEVREVERAVEARVPLARQERPHRRAPRGQHLPTGPAISHF